MAYEDFPVVGSASVAVSDGGSSKFVRTELGRCIRHWKVVRNRRPSIRVDRQTGRYSPLQEKLLCAAVTAAHSIWGHAKCMIKLKTENLIKGSPLALLLLKEQHDSKWSSSFISHNGNTVQKMRLWQLNNTIILEVGATTKRKWEETEELNETNVCSYKKALPKIVINCRENFVTSSKLDGKLP